MKLNTLCDFQFLLDCGSVVIKFITLFTRHPLVRRATVREQAPAVVVLVAVEAEGVVLDPCVAA